MSAIKDTLISLATVLVTLVYEYVRLEIEDTAKAGALLHDTVALMMKLEIRFDLWLIAFSLILGSWISAKKEARGVLVPPTVALAIGLLVILALFVPAAVLSDPYYVLRIWLPDALGLALVAWAVSATRSAH